jgi:LPXTG-motif cell wall-anchored protein
MEKKTNYQKIKSITAIVVITLVAIISFQNYRPTKIQLLFWDTQLNLFILVVVALLAGLLAGLLLFRKKKNKTD